MYKVNGREICKGEEAIGKIGGCRIWYKGKPISKWWIILADGRTIGLSGYSYFKDVVRDISFILENRM